MQLKSNLTLSTILMGIVAISWTPLTNHWRSFPHSINTILRRQVRRVKNYINQGIISDPIPILQTNIMRIV